MVFGNNFDSQKSELYSQLYMRLPAMRYVEQHSVIHYVGDVKGKRVLDLACGDGRYTRLMKNLGASEAVGIDISEAMIKLANKKEEDNPVGCTYHVADARTMEKVGEFDVVTAVFMLVFAENTDQLAQFGKVIYDNLRPGGYFVSLNVHSTTPTFLKDTLKHFGFIFENVEPIPDGSRFQITWPGSENGRKTTSIINYIYKPEIYERIFKNLQFSEFCIHDLVLSEEGKQVYPEGFWDVYMANPPRMIIKAKK